MKLKIFLTITFLFLLISINLIAQDSTKSNIKWGWSWEFDEFDEWMHISEKLPTISLQYGLSNPDYKNISSEFIDPGLLELQLGYTTRAISKYASYISKYIRRDLYIIFLSKDLSNQKIDTSKINPRTWRFGFSRSCGYGYNFGNFAIIPYYSYSLDWSRVDFQNTAANVVDQERLNRFDESFRFGTSNEGGIRVSVTSLISLEAGYQRSIIFERHLFWGWTGSAVIEVAAHELLDAFVKEILKRSPAAGPIVYFFLKNALGYGIYELRQEKMNWPFASVAPLSFDSFKFGVTFTF